MLFPVKDGQASQSLPPNEVVHIVEESKEFIETSTAATIKNVKIAPAAGCMTQHMVLYYILTVAITTRGNFGVADCKFSLVCTVRFVRNWYVSGVATLAVTRMVLTTTSYATPQPTKLATVSCSAQVKCSHGKSSFRFKDRLAKRQLFATVIDHTRFKLGTRPNSRAGFLTGFQEN